MTDNPKETDLAAALVIVAERWLFISAVTISVGIISLLVWQTQPAAHEVSRTYFAEAPLDIGDAAVQIARVQRWVSDERLSAAVQADEKARTVTVVAGMQRLEDAQAVLSTVSERIEAIEVAPRSFFDAEPREPFRLFEQASEIRVLEIKPNWTRPVLLPTLAAFLVCLVLVALRVWASSSQGSLAIKEALRAASIRRQRV